MSYISDLDMDTIRFNPSVIVDAVIKSIEASYNNELVINDPMNPMVSLLETSAHFTADSIIQTAILNRRQYPKVANSYDELYQHMTDDDYIGRFSTCADTTMTLILAKEEIYNLAIPVPNTTIRKLTIPKHTEFTVDGYSFSMQYPIDIKIMGHGGLQITYDASETSPIYDLTTNRVNYWESNYTISRVPLIYIEIPVSQFIIKSTRVDVVQSVAFYKSYTLTDKYYYCRVYRYNNASASWIEMSTTHSDQVFDISSPTAVLRVTDNLLTVHVPPIYTQGVDGITKIRVDVYTTKGSIDVSLKSYMTDQFTVKWKDHSYDEGIVGEYSSPLAKLSKWSCYSTEVCSGGSGEMSLVDLRKRIMANLYGDNDVAVTEANVISKLNLLGFTCSKYIDNVTNRSYLAGRDMPSHSSSSIPANTSLLSLYTTIEDLGKYSNSIINGDVATILPSTIFELKNGILNIVDDVERGYINSLSGDDLTDYVNNRTLLYTPFHYVLDASDSYFKTRAYYLDTPSIVKKTFNGENDTFQYSISLNEHQFDKTDYGWRLLVLTNSTEEFRNVDDANVKVQLRFKPTGESDYAYVNGTLLKRSSTNERLYEFRFESNLDFDKNNDVSITNFKMYDVNESIIYRLNLLTEVTLTFYVANITDTGVAISEMDGVKGSHLLPNDAISLYQESLTLKFGDELNNLWTGAQTTISSEIYKRHESIVYSTYTSNVYKRDASGNLVYTLVDGKIVLEIEHSAGDIIYTDNGDPIILYQVGDYVRDASGNLIKLENKKLERKVDLLLIDGLYAYSTDSDDIAYRTTMAETIVSWVTDTLDGVEASLSEQTDVYYAPKSTIGSIPVVVDNNVTKSISAEQVIEVRCTVDTSTYRDSSLRTLIENKIIASIGNSLNQTTVTLSDMIAKLNTVIGSDVIGFVINGFCNDEATTVTMTSDLHRLSLGKVLSYRSDGKYEVRDSISIEFDQHTKK